ncbi:MAG: hypothetical protein KC444_09265 [Nitrosopumilus sp.]|nr:hypothetical protein [Nitrosopumilus sp.]
MGTFADLYDVLVILKDHGSDVDLSGKWSVIEYDDGFPQSVKITLNARGGRFLTRTPIINKRDRIYVRITDRAGKITEDVFHVRRIQKIKRAGKVLQLKLSCPHQSENLWTRTVSFALKRTSNKEAIVEWVRQLNVKGSKDPTVEIPAFDTVKKVGNAFDGFTSNNHFYESLKAETVVDEIKNLELQPVEGGGSFEPMYVRFKSKYDHSTGLNLDTVQLQAFPQGYKDDGAGNLTNTPSVTLTQRTVEDSLRSNVLGLESEEDPEEGTIVTAIGDKSSGSYPVDFMKYMGAKDVFNSAKDWASGNLYKVGRLVRDNGNVYECIFEHTSSGATQPPNATFWIGRVFQKPQPWLTAQNYPATTLVRHQDIAYKCMQTHLSSSANEPGKDTSFWVRVNFVPTLDYSPLTKDKAQYWINALAGAKYAATNNSRTAMIDPNCIIPDTLHPRIPVDYVGTNPTSIPTELLVNLGSGNQVPHAFLMLTVDPATGNGSGAGAFAGSDKNGVTFAGNVVKYHDSDNDGIGEWVVFRQTSQDFEVFDWYESISWTKNPCTGVGSYVDSAGVCQIGSRGTQWKKGSYGLSEIPLVGKFGVWFDDKQFECVHSVKWDSANSRIDCGTKQIMNEHNSSTSAVFIKSAPLDTTRTFPYYVGFNIHSRFPRTSNAIPFGSVSAGEKINLSVFDFFNMFLTHEGKREWFGPQVEDYYPIQGFSFVQQLIATHSIFGKFDTEGDYSFGIWLADENMNQVIIEYNHSRNDSILPQEGPLSKAKPYVGVPGVSVFFSAQEPEIIDVFEPREWLMGGIYTKDSFDSQGRYLGLRSRFNGMSEIELALDAYRMTKPLVATNTDEPNNKPEYAIESLKVKASSIVSYAQLKNLVLGLSQLVNFERRNFKVPTKLRCDIQFGDPVYYTSQEIISDTTDSLPNTIKGVADRIIYTLSKPKGRGPNAATRSVHLVERLWP